MTRFFQRHSALTLCLALLLAFAPATRLFAQGTTGSIVGVVVDATGAAVPGATVTLKNTATGVSKTVTTDGAGRYTASALQNGSYSITATGTGFKTTQLTGVNLDIAQTLSENLSLAAGGATDFVDVEAQAVTTETETSSNGAVIGADAVAELPLANRQFYNLVEVAPGVAPPAQNSSMGFRGGMNVNGAPETANMFLVNGTFNLDISTNQPTFRPSVDTIAEFKVITGVPSADYGRVQGGQIIIVTKQGSNKFHGSLYEYIRNGAIEARPWSPLAAAAGSKSPAFKQNTFGATIGGPILKDKAFFFFGYEGQRIRQQITASSTVPTAWQQAGCSPTAITDPTTGVALTPTTTGACATAPYAGYDASTLSTWNSPSAIIGRQMLALAYPLPNVTPTSTNGLLTQITPSNDYSFNETRSETMDEYNSRIDYTLSAKDSFNGTFNHFHDPSFEPNNSLCASRTLPNFGCYTDQITYLANIGETHIFSANLLNVATFGWNRLQQPRTQQDATSIGTAWTPLNGSFTGPTTNANTSLGLPSITEASGYTTTGGQTNLPQNRWDNHFDIDEVLTWTHKAHTYKAGAQILVTKLTEFEISNGRGSLTFNPSTLRTANSSATANAAFPLCTVPKNCGSSGDTIVDTALGLVSTDSDTPTATNVYNRYNSFDFFVMDDWKIKPWLTLNLGLRYELDLPESEKFGNFSTFSPSAPNALAVGSTAAPISYGQTIGTGGIANANGTFLVANQIGQKTVYTADRNNFAPRVGFAWQPLHNDKTVVKGGYGVYFAEPQAFNEMLSYAIQYPIRYPKTFTPTAYTTGGSINLANPFPNELPAPGTPYCVSGTAGCNTPVIGQTCQSPCGLSPVVAGTEVDPHYATPYISQWTIGVQRQVTKSIVAEALYFGNKGSKIAFGCTANINYNANPDAGLVGQNYTYNATAGTYSAVAGGNLQVLRRYPNYGTLSFHTTGCSSEYESLQSRVQVSSKGGTSVLVSYTYSHAEDGLTAAQDPGIRAFDKGNSAFDIRHRLVISPVLPLPFGKGKMFANSGWESAVFGGFKVSGIYQYFTGRPFNITDSSSQSSASAGGDRPVIIAGASLTGNDSLTGAATHNKSEWFNVHALAYNPPGTYGNLAPNGIEGPGFDQLDLTLGRIFPIKEWAKAEFKVDAFNIANHPNFYNPLTTTFSGSTTFTSRAAPTTPGYTATNVGSFGTITQANGMREIQASVHITF